MGSTHTNQILEESKFNTFINMPRGGRGFGGGSRSGGSSFFSQRKASSAAAPPARQAPPPATASHGGVGLGGAMAQGAAFGVGAGMGSAAVHGMMGTGHRRYDHAEQQQSDVQAQASQSQYTSPCRQELSKFLECSQVQNDLSLCTAFNDLYKE